MTKICIGCGSVLQYTDSNKIGYSPKKDAKLCERCFRLKNYNEKTVIDLKYSNSDIVDLLNKKSDAVIFITDFLSLNQKVIDIYKSIKIKDKYLVINKFDYVPFSIKKEKYIEYIKETYNISEKIILTSATKGMNLSELNNIILSYPSCYFAGFTNSGKSTIMNKLAKMNGKKCETIESLMPNTTLDFIKLKLNDNTVIYDTPGFINDYDFNILSFPKKFIKPVTLQIKENDTIQIGNDILVKNLSGENSFTFYMGEAIQIKKVYDTDLKGSRFIYVVDENSDLCINGLGFINIKKSCNLEVTSSNCEIRKSMF